MTWDPIWEATYRARDWGRYPPEELVRFVARHYYGVPDRSAVRILEIGCGTGANLWYLAREGFTAVGIDGSQTALKKAMERMKGEPILAQLRVQDWLAIDALAIEKWFGTESFDAVLDVCCLQHNRLADTRAILEQVRAVLKPGGRVFSMMVAAGSWGDGTGTLVEPGTYTDVPEGPAQGMGLTHFIGEYEARDLFAGFEDVDMTVSTRTMVGLTHRWGHWVIEGRKAG